MPSNLVNFVRLNGCLNRIDLHNIAHQAIDPISRLVHSENKLGPIVFGVLPRYHPWLFIRSTAVQRRPKENNDELNGHHPTR